MRSPQNFGMFLCVLYRLFVILVQGTECALILLQHGHNSWRDWALTTSLGTHQDQKSFKLYWLKRPFPLFYLFCTFIYSAQFLWFKCIWTFNDEVMVHYNLSIPHYFSIHSHPDYSLSVYLLNLHIAMWHHLWPKHSQCVRRTGPPLLTYRTFQRRWCYIAGGFSGLRNPLQSIWMMMRLWKNK